ncbi:hypothetical protein A2926_02080 [Candidatus Giovannonibacteria bacterium RIFCSPLOWO2_01_FULL_44_40]|uniref:Polymerase beta nucleotidyltransferase domain-containing protein n=1 Tax=Candidatus Giovannonibacteria bacterium RIFCSPHIGHO2_01_FULL_45_23 TaxID=1798325 RepID=A0A1F5VFE8_9BACT|nr:MAG: hypothetical protein A2834_02220 [Candidatus Giovannonibacteria bacterium RIFCSPHIGHO2_01_FULL_45_23]OGF75047.1 MAG: hypothetical protein A3C77_02605 [Candidatus Giovannonibacteria bacterium RIFCSPHIGHO2_02_FULL_45_13]OGF80357.1 MAG: hypothetical protein A2926_02080 [Candidatus Giovannonibacteria bacterium RIFCSPLOWO2_01_FULL_44_40]
MRLEHYPVEKLKKDIVRIVSKYLDIGKYRVFFFGSRVAGTGTERSDIDIGIDGLKPVPFNTLLNIRSEIGELPVLYKIDVIDFGSASGSFRNVASKKVEFITKVKKQI